MSIRASSTEIMRRLTTLFPSALLEERAEDFDVVERDSKLQVPAFVWWFVLSFAAGESPTVAGFRCSYNNTADSTLSPSGFYQRLTPTLAEYLRDLGERGIDGVVIPDAVDTGLAGFRDVMIADGITLQLHWFIADEYEPWRGEQGR